jgi:hypothetical protein
MVTKSELNIATLLKASPRAKISAPGVLIPE